MQMNNNLQFIQHAFLWPALAIAFLLAVLYIWTVWKGIFNKRFFLNSLIGVVAVLVLVCLFLRPAWSNEVSSSAVLLTQGYSTSQLDSIKKNEKGIKVINYSPGNDLSTALDSIGQAYSFGARPAWF